MKQFICLITFCLVAVQAFPDELIKLEPETGMKPLEEAISTTEASLSVEKAKERKIYAQGTTADRTRLMNDLFKVYNKRVNPDDIKLKFGATLLDFRVLETKNALESHIWFSQIWTDIRLQWLPEEYGGVEVLRITPSKIWTPDVTLYNTADHVNMVNCWETNAIVTNEGKVSWIPPCKLTSMCHLNLKREPYGENTCSLKFGSWTFDGYTLDIQLDKPSIDISSLSKDTGFEIVGNTAERIEKYYSCCKEPYPNLTYNLTLKRIPGEELFKKF